MTARPAVLRAAVAACQAAAYGYGVVGAHLSGGDERAAAAAYDEVHRLAAQGAALLVATGQTAPAAQPAYALPFAVRSRHDALRLAAYLEAGLADAFYDLVGDARPAVRRVGVGALARAAGRAAHWRNAAGLQPVTTAFPGRPG